MNRGSPYSDWPWLLYYYLIRTYFRFLAAGKCLAFPSVLQIQTQSFCNGRCVICPYPTSSQVMDHGKMDGEVFAKIVDEVASAQQASILVFALHNEPLLDHRLFDWVGRIKERSPGIRCIVVTNGELLDRFDITEILQSRLDQLIISFNAYSRETYERINTGLDFDRVMRNIQNQASDLRMRPRVQLRFALTTGNVHEVRHAVDYWRKRGVETKVRGITNRAGALKDFDRLRADHTRYLGKVYWALWHRLMDAVRGVTGCDFPFYQMNILFNGDVIVCCHDWNRKVVIGNIQESSLEQVWNSDRLNQIRGLIIRKKYAQIESCRECSLMG